MMALSSCAKSLGAFDSIESLSASSLRARKTVSDSDLHFAGHFPGAPSYPGLFTLDAAVHAVRIFLQRSGKKFDRMHVRSLRHHGDLHPGQELRLTIDTQPITTDGMLQVTAHGNQNEKSTAEIQLDFHVVENEKS